MCDICTEAVHSVALWTRVTLSFGHVWHMYRSSPFRSTLNTGYIKLWTCVALDQCKLWTPFAHFCPYFHTPYTLLCPKDEFTFTFRTGLIWKIDNPCTTLFLAPGSFDNPYKGAESAGCQKQPFEDVSLGTTPPPRIPVTTKIIPFLAGSPQPVNYKPSFVTGILGGE